MEIIFKISEKMLKLYCLKDNFLNFDLKAFLQDYYDISPKQFRNLLSNNAIKVFEKCPLEVSNKDFKFFQSGEKCIFNIGDEVVLDIGYFEDNSNINFSCFPNLYKSLNILYEDDYLLIFEKQLPLPIMQTSSHPNDTYQNIVKEYFDSISLHKKIRFVNRLDLQTTGIVVIAKSSYVHEILQRQSLTHLTSKKYLCLTTKVLGNVGDVFEVEKNIYKDEKTFKRISSSDNLANSKKSKTIFKIVKQLDNSSVLECELQTGRCHQIRSHLESEGIYIIGDELYNPNTEKTESTRNVSYLHSYLYTFYHPITKEFVTITNYPKWFDEITK